MTIQCINGPSLRLKADGLTARQAEVLYAIAVLATQGAVKQRPLCKAIGVKSVNGLMCHLYPLAKRGYITWDPGLAGTIRLAKPLAWEEVP